MRLEYEGRFLAEIEEYGIFQSKTSQAVAVDIFFTTLSYLGREEPEEYSGYRTRGRFFIIGKTGDVLPEQAAALAAATGWDGDLNVVASGDWQPASPVQIIVDKEQDDKGRIYYNAARILRRDWQPARAGNVTAGDGRRIATRYTSALKSVVAKYRRDQGQGQAVPAPKAPDPPPATDEKSAWSALQAKSGDMSQEDLESTYLEAVRYFGEGKEISELTPEQWRQVGAIDPKTWTPF